MRFWKCSTLTTKLPIIIQCLCSGKGQVIISNYKNSSTTLGGLPAIKIISYFLGDVTEKEMQLWTYVPGKHVLIEMIYIAQPSKYSLYLPIVERMINSVEIAH
jgi:hypothetical protein